MLSWAEVESAMPLKLWRVPSARTLERLSDGLGDFFNGSGLEDAVGVIVKGSCPVIARDRGGVGLRLILGWGVAFVNACHCGESHASLEELSLVHGPSVLEGADL